MPVPQQQYSPGQRTRRALLTPVRWSLVGLSVTGVVLGTVIQVVALGAMAGAVRLGGRGTAAEQAPKSAAPTIALPLAARA